MVKQFIKTKFDMHISTCLDTVSFKFEEISCIDSGKLTKIERGVPEKHGGSHD